MKKQPEPVYNRSALCHEIRCTRCGEWRDVATTHVGRCLNKAACGIRRSRRKRLAKQEGQL